MADVYNVPKSVNGQKRYCEEHDAPHFAPKSGVCWKCNRNIYEKCIQKNTYGERTTGITTHVASTQLVTGCPHCNRTYCD